MTSRVSRPAFRLWKYFESLDRSGGWIAPKLATLAAKYKRARSTVQRWLGELFAAGIISTERRGPRPPLYTVLIPTTDTCIQLPLFTEQEEPEVLRQALPARKPPTGDAGPYRKAFSEAWTRLASGWVEPAGARVPPQVRYMPDASLIPTLADSARSVGLEPVPAILSMDRAVVNALSRVSGARNPAGLIVHIARDTWKRLA